MLLRAIIGKNELFEAFFQSFKRQNDLMQLKAIKHGFFVCIQ